MSQKEQEIKRLLSKPKDYTYDEARGLLSAFGFIEYNRGKTSGSAVAFFSESDKRIIRLHKPHPSPILKMYQVNQLIEALKLFGLI